MPACPAAQLLEKILKKIQEKFAGLNFCRTFAIPINKAVVVKW